MANQAREREYLMRKILKGRGGLQEGMKSLSSNQDQVQVQVTAGTKNPSIAQIVDFWLGPVARPVLVQVPGMAPGFPGTVRPVLVEPAHARKRHYWPGPTIHPFRRVTHQKRVPLFK